MQRDNAYLLDILEAAKLVLSYVENQSKEKFLSDIQCQDAVIRRFEIIGEASRRVSDQFRDTPPDIPWQEMIGMRNIMIHEYDDVDMLIVWETLKRNLPSLVIQVEKIVS